MSVSKVMLVRKVETPPPAPPPRRGARSTPPAAPSTSPADNWFWVDFNPASLRMTLNNQFGQDPPQSHARATVAKLDCELIFDTTESGSDVGAQLRQLESFTRATNVRPASGGAAAQPAGHVPLIEFHWGVKLFEGVIESLTQTIEYWSSEGIPMRATVQLSMKETTPTAPPSSARSRSADSVGTLGALGDVVPAATTNSDKPATDAANKGGNGLAARSIAALNGLESMRGGVGASASASAGIGAGASASAGASLGVSAGIKLEAAASFAASGGVSAGAGAGASLGFGLGASAGASAGAGLGASAGIGMAGGASIGAGAGIGVGASAGIGIGASAGVSVGASASAGFGVSAGASARASATAGVSASAGAFAGLGSSKMISGNTGIDPARLMPPPSPALIGGAVAFDTTGRLISDGSPTVAASYTAQRSVRIF